MLVKNVIARKTKKARLKRVKKFIKQKTFISIDDLILTSIENPEVFWKTNDITWQTKMTKKKETKRRKEYKKNENENRDEDDEIEINEMNEMNENEDEMIFITDTVEDSVLRSTINDHDKQANEISKQANFVTFEDVDTDDEKWEVKWEMKWKDEMKLREYYREICCCDF